MLAERTGLSAKTIRYYEDVGLMPPTPRTPSGYRDYDHGAESRLRFIRAAQSIGLSLGEIREVLSFRDRGEAPCAHVTALIERHAAELSERIQALDAMRHDLLGLAARGRRLGPRTEGSGFCHIIESVSS